MNVPFKNPSYITLITLGGIARWKRRHGYWFQGGDGNEPNNQKTTIMNTMMVNGCEDEVVSISMDDRQRSPILDELSA